jgi:hypothetical protein
MENWGCVEGEGEHKQGKNRGDVVRILVGLLLKINNICQTL